MIAIRLPLTLVFIFNFNFLSAFAQFASDFPGHIPLVLRSPYFGTWINANTTATNVPSGLPPAAWTKREQRWAGYVLVDGTSYMWMGIGHGQDGNTTTVSVAITPTRTIFTVDAGPVRMNLTYLSPIEPSDWVRQSFPFAYLAIDLWATDGKAHSIQLYSDISGQFVSSEDKNAVRWDTQQTSTSIYHEISRTVIPSIVENDDVAEDGTAYFGMLRSTPGLTWRSGATNNSRVQFLSSSKLASTKDTNFRAIDNTWPVVAYAIDLGMITQTTTPSPAVFALGFVRNPVILRHVKEGGIESRTSYFWTKYNSIGDGIDAFLTDFPSALSRAVALDEKIMREASSVSTKYADIVAMSLRQTMAAVEITVANGSNGQLNISDVQAFVKDIGTSRRVNAVETLYAALPAYLYLNASLVGLMLDPLLEYQGSTQYSNNYAAPDLGSSFPDAMGNNADTAMLAVENCGSMLIMALAHAQKSGEGRLIHRHYPTLKKWADYLVMNTLQPTGYTNSDGLTGAGTSNLALKGIIGIYAMSQINQALEPQGMLGNYTEYYMNKATEYFNQWMGLAISNDHITSTYGNTDTWGVIYNLYASKLLESPIVPDSLYDLQAKWYDAQAPQAPAFGFATDKSDPHIARSHWTMFTAASVAKSSSDSRDTLVDMAHLRAFNKGTINANPTTYSADDGAVVLRNGGQASPRMGAAFALLALNLPNSTITVPTEPDSVDLDVAAIAGGVTGGVVGVLLLAFAVYMYTRRRRRIQGSVIAVPTPYTEPEYGQPAETERIGTVTPFVGRADSANDSSSTKTLLQMRQAENEGRASGHTHSLSNKARPGYIPTDAPHGYPASQSYSWAESSSNPTEMGSDSPSISTPNPHVEAINLRTEVEELRREMAEMRRIRDSIHESDEPPPGYGDHLRDS